MRILLLSHFNIFEGPIVVLKIPEEFTFSDIKNVPKHLNLDESEFFIYEYETFKTANLTFKVPSKMKRTDYEELMISVVIIDEDISPKVFQTTLRELKEELNTIKNIYMGLYDSSKKGVAKFLEIKEILIKYYEIVNNIKGIRLDIDLDYNFPWGTHICYFYQNVEDLTDIIIPYLKKGLENNEFCVCVTSEDLNEDVIKERLKSEIKNFNKFLEKRQIEIFPYTGWYLKDREFAFQNVIDGWIEKYNYAMSRGFNGLRVIGNTVWVQKKDWKDFSDYEEEINNIVGNYRMILLCTYSAEKCSMNEILGVMKTHQVATIRNEGKWEILRKYNNAVFS